MTGLIIISPEIIIISELLENNDIDKNNMIILLENELDYSFYKGNINLDKYKIIVDLVDYVYNNKMEFLISLIDGDIFKQIFTDGEKLLLYLIMYLI